MNEIINSKIRGTKKLKVVEFNIEDGLYQFEFIGLETEFHSHPTIEIIRALKGRFLISTATKVISNLTFCIIDRNVKHKLYATDCTLEITMIEHNAQLIKEILSKNKMTLVEGLYCENDDKDQIDFLNNVIQHISKQNYHHGYDPRVASVITYLNNNDLEYDMMIKTLKQVAFLSESRLSHLFKANMGISLKKYLLWSKLKKTIQQHLNKKEDLFTSLLNSGFYDQPHFSKAFKTMLGVKPTKYYK